jgi:hypothetical protein
MTDPMIDPEGHSAAEDLDEDRLRVDPLEEGMDPPEHWSQAIDHDDAQPHDLDERLREETPDTTAPPEPRDEVERMDADGELEGHPEEVPFEEYEREELPEEARRGQMADEGAGSVARELRTPRPPA